MPPFPPNTESDNAQGSVHAETTRAFSKDASNVLTTGSAHVFTVRSANNSDEKALEEFFTHVTAEDIRFRFLTSVQHVGHSQLAPLVGVDHSRTENFLAFDPISGALIATAMIAADDVLARAEVAIAIRSDFKHRGIGWSLLDHVAQYAQSRGFNSLEAIESRDNRQAISLEQEMGFTILPCPGDPTLLIVRKTFGLEDVPS